MEKGKLLSLCSRERRHFFRARFACLSKVVVFGCKSIGTSKGYGERETSLATLEREGGTFSGFAMLASQKWWFLVAKVLAPVRGKERGKLLSLRSRERGALFQGSLCSPLKSGGFWLQKYWHRLGVWREGNFSHYAQERGGHFFRACFAHLSKVVVFGCKISGTSKGYGERKISLTTLEREGGTFSGLT